jgi:hypothetical protein
MSPGRLFAGSRRMAFLPPFAFAVRRQSGPLGLGRGLLASPLSFGCRGLCREVNRRRQDARPCVLGVDAAAEGAA